MTTEFTLHAAIEDFVGSMRVEGYSSRTVELYGSSLAYLERYVAQHGCSLLAELTPALVRSAMATYLDEPQAGPANWRRSVNWRGGETSANTLGTAARALVRRYHRAGVTAPDLTTVRCVKVPERVQPRLTGPEFHALEQALGTRLLRQRVPRFIVARDSAIVQVLAETGLRAAEMCALNVGDVDFVEGSIMVRRGKGAKDRALSIVDPDPAETDGGAALRAVADYLAHREKLPGALLNPALWLSSKGNRLTTNKLRDSLAQLCREAGIRGNRPPHAFRRGWFSTSYQADPNALPVLQARMGWSTPDMARVYTRGANIDLARTTARPSVAKVWRQASEAREEVPRPKPAPVQRQENLSALLGFIQGDPALRKALLQALGGAA